MTEEKTILLVDGSNLIFRMYFALERTGMTAPDGRPSWAIFGFFKALLDILEKQKPTALVAAFDTKGPTFRHEAVSTYKANRPKEMPDNLASQWPEIKRGMQLIGMNLVELPGYEADDLIGTLACQAQANNWKVLIFSGDKDNFQLVNENVKVIMPSVNGIQEIDRAEVKAKMGIYPEQVVDYKSLRGDASDNIPGVPGIGEKTAIKLIDEFGSLKNIFANLAQIKPDSVRKKLAEGQALAEESRFLAEIKQDCTIAYPFKNLTHHLKPDIPQLIEFLREYRLISLEKRLPKIFKAFGDLEINFIEQEKSNLQSAQVYHVEGIPQVYHAEGIPLTKPQLKDNLSEDEDTDFPFAEFEAKQAQMQNAKENIKIDYQTILSEEALEEFFQKAKNSPALALDLETDSLNTWDCQIVGLSLGATPSVLEQINPDLDPPLSRGARGVHSVYIPLKHNYLGAPEQLKTEMVLHKLKSFLADYKGQLFVQNLKFEYKILKRHGLELPKSTLDTMLASYIHNPDQAHGLKSQAFQVFHFQMMPIEQLIGPKGKNQKTMDQISIEEVSKYACDDAALTLALGEHYTNILTQPLKKLWTDIESPLAFLLADMELTGIYINAAKLEELSRKILAQITAYEHEIVAELGAEGINLNSSQQLSKALTAKGFKLSKATSSGQLSTDSKTLQELAEKDSSGLIKKIIEHRMLCKLRSTYTDSLVKQINPVTKRVHGEFNQALTSTGRLSSSNPNLQNIPVKNQEFGKLIRASFEAENGNILLSADYSQIELRILAHYTEDPTLLDAFQKGQDIHLRTAAEIFEVPPEQVTGDMRRLGKTLNFALIYQQGTYATAQQLGIPNKKAAEFIEKYFQAFPKIRPFMEETLEAARQQGYVETLWGRRRYFTNLNAKAVMLRKAEERAAFNAPLQGTAADMMKIAMLRVVERFKREQLKAKIVLQVHDEIVIEAPKEQFEIVQNILLTEMPIEQPLKVPIEVQIGHGPNWAECK